MPYALLDLPALVAGHGRAALLTADGEILVVPTEEAAQAAQAMPAVLVVHRPATLRRLGIRTLPCLDLLELFAFVLPGRHAAPTPRGLAEALDIDPPTGLEAEAGSLPNIAHRLLQRLTAARTLPLNRHADGLAARMGQAGWPWAPYVLGALGSPNAAPSAEALMVWKRLPEWEETAPLPPAASHPVSETEARTRLSVLLGPDAEQRPGQSDFAGAAAAAFAPRTSRGDPQLVLAEAGTGTGKTIGYIAPASLWAERNRGTVWISTFTRHLQRQIDAELARVFPDPAERGRRVVMRKGRENYLCLLNLQDTVQTALAGAGFGPVIGLGLIARWALVTRDGDIQGGDLPGWITELFGAPLIAALADRRGECIHGGCPHWRTCFVEHSIRKARQAELVIANHALVMIQAAHGFAFGGDGEDSAVPTRYVFDEGHHLFDAADNAFAAVLSGQETAELRRWLLGSEGSRSRARGLRTRMEDLVAGRTDLEQRLDAALKAARCLPGPGWVQRLADAGPALGGIDPGRPNPTEALLGLLRAQLLARTPRMGDQTSGIECDVEPVSDALGYAARRLATALTSLIEPLHVLRLGLLARLDTEADELDSAFRNRIEGACRSLERRALAPLTAWRSMLSGLQWKRASPGTRPDHVTFLRLDRRGGLDRDVGLYRHALDPTIPFALTLAAPAHGLLVTSATLRDSAEDDPEAAWAVAEARVGAPHLPSPAIRAAVGSPFDYAAQTRCFVVTDVAHGDIGALAGAYRSLFLASGGGALGLFTAISRLIAVHQRIAPALEQEGIPLYAQHVDAMNNATLVDIFRTEEESCLLGTDAMRDGVDVPGRALRLVVFEKVPWPRPDILHRERRIHLSDGDPRGYDDRIARLRLRQAFGRLIRRTSDRGVFVLLDRRTPERLLSAFPAGVTIRRVGLAEAAAETRNFLAPAVHAA